MERDAADAFFWDCGTTQALKDAVHPQHMEKVERFRTHLETIWTQMAGALDNSVSSRHSKREALKELQETLKLVEHSFSQRLMDWLVNCIRSDRLQAGATELDECHAANEESKKESKKQAGERHP